MYLNLLFIGKLASRDSDLVLSSVIEVFSLVFQLPQIHDRNIQPRPQQNLETDRCKAKQAQRPENNSDRKMRKAGSSQEDLALIKVADLQLPKIRCRANFHVNNPKHRFLKHTTSAKDKDMRFLRHHDARKSQSGLCGTVSRGLEFSNALFFP